MTDVAKQMYHGTPAAAVADVYGPTAATKAVIQSVHVTNTTGTQATITVSTGASGVDTDASRLLAETEVPPRGVLDLATFTVLESGDYITAWQGTAGALTLTISGVEL